MRLRKHIKFLYAAGLLSISSLIIICVSLRTKEWIKGEASVADKSKDFENSYVNYGLLEGTLIRKLLTSSSYYLYLTCIWTSNACGWSCLRTAEERKDELEALLAGKKPAFQCFSDNEKISRQKRSQDKVSLIFLNATAWTITIAMMILLAIIAIANLGLILLNCLKSPAQTYLNIQGIYVTIGISTGLNLLILLIFGCHYNFVNINNLAIRDTIIEEYNSIVYLGYSYWILLVPLCFYVLSVGLLMIREKKLNSEPTERKIEIENTSDVTLVMF